MAKRMITLMAALLVLGFVVTGCGDDESSGDSGETAAQTETVTDTETETVTDDTDTDADNGGAVVPAQVVERCKDGIDSASQQLSDDAKNSLEDLCEKAGSGNAEDVKDAIAEVCKKNVASIPEGVPGRDQAIAACEQAGK